MAQNINKDSRKNGNGGRSQTQTSKSGSFIKRDCGTGRFTDEKTAGAASKGANKESDKATKRKALTLEVFNAIYESRHKE